MPMDIDSVLKQEEFLKNSIKKECLLCMGRARLAADRGTPEKDNVQRNLARLRENYNEKFNALRRMNAGGEEIQLANSNRRYVLDVIHTCAGCNREVDRANREMANLR